MFISGLDEVGRGALAGPLIAVISVFKIPDNKWMDLCDFETDNSPISGINDSKKLSSSKRDFMFHRILRWDSFIDFGLGEVYPEEINKVGIDKANELAFERAAKDISVTTDFILIDGINHLYGWDPKQQHHEPKADERFWPVGAASILAKVIRDRYMAEIGADYPQYKWDSNSGYGSKDHQEAIQQLGPCPHHRTQFIRKLWRS